MSYQSPYTEFVFEDYSFSPETSTAEFHYSFDGVRHFTEKVVFPFTALSSTHSSISQQALEYALQLAFYVAGTSYYKTFPTKKVSFKKSPPDVAQADFLQKVYTEGLSQFIFENGLTVSDMVIFEATHKAGEPVTYEGKGILALQSGGKDSLLMTTLLEENQQPYSSMYISSTDGYPDVLRGIQVPPRVVRRSIDSQALQQAAVEGALNGHVPVTYIVESYAIIDAILHNEKTVIVSIGAEGGEAHEYVGELAVNHQWSKTWEAEILLAEYVHRHISPDLQIGSPVRGYTELKIAQLFTQHSWERFGQSFSSCNRANYLQGADNATLKWCGECPKCANSYLLFAPFVEPAQLRNLFGGQDLLQKPLLTETFKGLLGIDGVMKPFECIGEIEELRLAYQMAQENFGASTHLLPFAVARANFEYSKLGPSQQWAQNLISIE